MGEPARQRATEEAEPDLGDLKRRYAALLARAEAGLALTPGDRHLTALVITLRDAVGELARVTFGEARIAMAVAQARGALSEVPAPARQRVPRARDGGRRPLLNVVRDLEALPTPGPS